MAALTSALEKFSMAVDPASSSHKLQGISFKPEYYVQHVYVKARIPLKQVDHTKLSYRELVYGKFCVVQHLILWAVIMSLIYSQFQDSVYVDDDRHIVTEVIVGDKDTFVAGDSLGVSANFHAGNLIVNKPAFKQSRKPGSQKFVKKFGSEKNESKKGDGSFDDISYAFNYKRCYSANCTNKHICKQFGGHHRASGCLEKKSTL